MKKVILEEQVKIKAVKNFSGKDKLIDYYIEQPGQEKIYALVKCLHRILMICVRLELE